MSFQLIPSLETFPQLLSRCKQPAGRWTVLIVFTLLLSLLNTEWLTIGAFLAITTAFPPYRRAVVSAGGVVIAVARTKWIDPALLDRLAAQQGLAHMPHFAVCVVVASAFLLLAGLAALAFRFPRSLASRRPVLAAVCSFFALVTAVSVAPLTGWSYVTLWILVLAITHLFWFFCYTLTDRDQRNRDPVPLQVGLWRPAWMASEDSCTPFAKGAAYLRRIEAHNAEEFAVTQIKGLKLLLWTLILNVVRTLLAVVLYRKLGIPEFETAFAGSVSGHPFAWYWNCLSLVSAFVISLLQMSVFGHQIIACARMAGFRALRNTYRPLESRTLAEFWNRYYYYFKELMVDMFFYPTYLRYFKKHSRLRMVVATMAAACAGNALFHFLRDISVVAELGWWRAIAGFQTYLFYCFVLGAAISISQLRGKRKEDPSHSWVRRRLVPVLGVAGFYCFLHIFDDSGRTHDLREHFVFLGRMFGF